MPLTVFFDEGSSIKVVFIVKIAKMTISHLTTRSSAMLTITSSEAQNTFGNVIDKSQREIISVTRRGRVATLVMSPEVLEDYIEGRMAQQTEAQGMLTAEQTKITLDKYR
jgi:hypothetical protein